MRAALRARYLFHFLSVSRKLMLTDRTRSCQLLLASADVKMHSKTNEHAFFLARNRVPRRTNDADCAPVQNSAVLVILQKIAPNIA